MVTGSTAVLMLALTAAAWLWREGRHPPALLLAAPIAIGVLASNVLAYREVNLAPRDQLAELEDIGSRIAGQGPTLMTEYQPYGVRHFLRDADPEGASELRRRQVRLRDGSTLDKGGFADTDQIALADLLVYRTLVLRRSPAQSRPPSPYRLIDRGDYYTVWQRPEGDAAVIDQLPLGNSVDPAAVPDCDEVRALAAPAPPGARLLAVPRGPVIVLQADQLAVPPGWRRGDDPGYLYPDDEGEADATFMAAGPGRAGVWLGGSVRDRLETRVNGQSVGTVRDELNNFGQYVRLGEAEVKAGPNSLSLLYEGPDLAPGSAGDVYPSGPLILAPDDIDSAITSVHADRATALCGRRWDWIELTA
jgi:hypothetical protein